MGRAAQRTARIAAGWLLAAGAAVAPLQAEVLPGCQDCELRVGLGSTYHFWGETGGPLNATHWNFASQLVMRVQLPRSASDLELSMRHWSNAGIRLPNRGQDFFTVSYAFGGS